MKDRVTIAIDNKVIKQIDILAEKEGRSRSNFIELLLKEKLINSHGDSSRTDNTEV